MKYPELIFLWGMPGSGKSTLGKKLANHLSYSWIDTDVSIEKSEGKTIEQIFNEEGEVKFRTLEKNCLFWNKFLKLSFIFSRLTPENRGLWSFPSKIL